MFNEGDIVRCINRRYRYTSYMRPCKVEGYDYLGKLLIEPFGDDCTYDVEDKYFEIVPPMEILEEGQKITVRDMEEGDIVEFVRYLHNDMVRLKVNGCYKDIDIERIINTRGFYI